MKIKNGSISATIFVTAAITINYIYYSGWFVSLHSILLGAAYCFAFEAFFIEEFNRGDTYGVEWQRLSIITMIYLVVPTVGGLVIAYGALVADLPGADTDAMLCFSLTLLSSVAAVTIDWALFRSDYLKKQRTTGKQVIEEAVGNMFSRKN